MSVTIPEILSNFSGLGYSAGDVLSTGTVVRRRGLQVTRGARAALPQAGRRDRGRDRAHRRAPQPDHLLAGGPRHAAAAARPALGRGRVVSHVSWPRDDAKLDRVRALMRERGLDALVVRAPDNVLYLTNFWGMKGYDAVVFPAEGEPALICLEPSRDDAERDGLDDDVRLFAGYDERDPRPPSLRALELAAAIAEQYEAVGIELSLGTQATDRMVGEPTTFPKAWFDAFPHAQDATPLLNEARTVKTRAGDRADAARERDRGRRDGARPGGDPARDDRGAGRRRVARLRPRRGHGLGGKVELALGFSLVWSGDGIRTFTATSNRPGRRGRADAVRDLGLRRRLLVRPHEEPRPGELADRYRELEAGLLERLRRRGRVLRPGREPARARSAGPRGDRGARVPRAAVASDLPRRRGPGPRAAVCASGGRRHDRARAWFLQSSQDATGRAVAACASRTTS